jgi:hypothetical protein
MEFSELPGSSRMYKYILKGVNPLIEAPELVSKHCILAARWVMKGGK